VVAAAAQHLAGVRFDDGKRKRLPASRMPSVFNVFAHVPVRDRGDRMFHSFTVLRRPAARFVLQRKAAASRRGLR